MHDDIKLFFKTVTMWRLRAYLCVRVQVAILTV